MSDRIIVEWTESIDYPGDGPWTYSDATVVRGRERLTVPWDAVTNNTWDVAQRLANSREVRHLVPDGAAETMELERTANGVIRHCHREYVVRSK